MRVAQFNKRLILEHATRVKPAYALKSKDLIAGVAGASGEAEKLVRQELPADLMCGFEGASDATGMYRKTAGISFRSDPTAIIGTDFSNGGGAANKD